MTSIYAKTILKGYDRDKFQDMDNFELSEDEKYALSIKLQFPKFSKGFAHSDFSPFIEAYVGGEEHVSALGRLSFPNEWQMQLKSHKIRESLVRLGRVKVDSRTLWITPLSQKEVRGFIHWMPNAISEQSLKEILERHGEVMFIEIKKENIGWTKVDCDSRYFAMNLKPGQTKEDIPHFFKIDGHHGLITIRGRAPSCFHCRIIGHRKAECQKYKQKLSAYCNRQPGSSSNRPKPRGKRYCPLPDPQNPGASASKKNRKRKKKNKAATSTKAQQTVSNDNTSVTEKTESAEACGGDDVVSKIQSLLQNIDLNALQKLSELQSSLTALASVINNVAKETKEQKELSNTVAATKKEHSNTVAVAEKELSNTVAATKKEQSNTVAATETEEQSNVVAATEKEELSNTVAATEKEEQLNAVAATEKEEQSNAVAATEKEEQSNAVAATGMNENEVPETVEQPAGEKKKKKRKKKKKTAAAEGSNEPEVDL